MKLADMALRQESSRLLTWRAAMLKDQGLPYSKVCSNTCEHCFGQSVLCGTQQYQVSIDLESKMVKHI